MRVLAWHANSAWMTAFVQGPHDYFVPWLKDRSAFGRGRDEAWPESVLELRPHELAQLEVDAVVLQRPQELGLASTWLGRKPGIDIPAVYVEHDTPQGVPNEMRHPMADHPELTLVHVTHFNRLFWNAGSTPTRVIEPGIVDPGYRYQGELPHSTAVFDDTLTRHAREAGADLLEHFSGVAPVDVFGAASGPLGGQGDLARPQLHAEMARRRVYLHLNRWTSLGLPLIEAMHLGMPVIALATTEVPAAVPSTAGIVSNCIETLEEGIRELVSNPERARRMGRAARRAARKRYGIERFLGDWDGLLEEIAR